MKTFTEELNEKVGCPVFAEQVDQYGLPVGGWNIPTLSTETFEETKIARFTLGTFRVAEDGELYVNSVFEEMDYKVFLTYKGRSYDNLIESVKNDLLKKLVEKISEHK